MLIRQNIHTDRAPKAIGTYSQAVKVGTAVYLSGQIPLDSDTMQIVEGDVRVQIERVFENLSAVAVAAGGGLQDVVKLTVYLTDLANFPVINDVMAAYFSKPYPARAAIGVASLPMGAQVEIEGILMVAEENLDLS